MLDTLRVEVGYQYQKARDRALAAVAWHLPRRLVMWCAIRLIAQATVQCRPEVPLQELTALEALACWPVGNPRQAVGHSQP